MAKTQSELVTKAEKIAELLTDVKAGIEALQKGVDNTWGSWQELKPYPLAEELNKRDYEPGGYYFGGKTIASLRFWM